MTGHSNIFFRNSFATLSITLLATLCAWGQTVSNNTPPSGISHITPYANSLKEKAAQAYLYAERSHRADNLNEAKASARHALGLLEEIKITITDTQTAFDPLITTDSHKKYAKLLISISSDLIDMQNKTSWATHKVNKIISTNEFDEVKSAAAEVMSEIKKMESLLAETISNIALVDHELNNK